MFRSKAAETHTIIPKKSLRDETLVGIDEFEDLADGNRLPFVS